MDGRMPVLMGAAGSGGGANGERAIVDSLKLGGKDGTGLGAVSGVFGMATVCGATVAATGGFGCSGLRLLNTRPPWLWCHLAELARPCAARQPHLHCRAVW